MNRSLGLTFGFLCVVVHAQERVPFEGFSSRIAETLSTETELISQADRQLREAREQILLHSREWSKSKRAEAWGLLGMRYQARSNLVKAAQAYRSALEETEVFRWRYLLAYVLDRHGETEAAIVHYRQALRTRPGDVFAGFRLGLALSVSGAAESALTVLKRVNRIAPERAFILNGLADLYIAEEQWSEARRYLEDAAALEPDAGQLAYKLALVYRHLGQQDQAGKWMAKRNMGGPAVADPVLMEVLENNPDFHVVSAERAWNLGQYNVALEEYRRALDLLPQDNGIRLAYAYTLRRLDRPLEAIEQIKTVLAQDANFAPAWFLLAKVHVAMSDFESAYDTASRSVEIYDDLGTHGTFQDQEAARALFAALAMQGGKFATAAVNYRVLNTRYSDKPYYRYWLAMALLAQGHCELARADLASVLTLKPQWGEAHLVHTRASALCGDSEARRKAIASAIALVRLKDDSDTRITRAYAELGVGRIAEARSFASAELPHPDAAMLLEAVAQNKMPLLPFAEHSDWWIPVEAKVPEARANVSEAEGVVQKVP